MKKFWYESVEGLKAPLFVYGFALILLGLGNTFSSNNEMLSMILLAFRFFGGLLITLFPLFVVVNVIGKRHEDSVPIMGGCLSYILLHVVTMFVANQTFPRYYYLNISVPGLNLSQNMSYLPVKMGLIASLIAILIVIYTYRASRRRFNYGILTFIDNDTWFLIVTSVITIIAGIVVSWFFPYAVNVLRQFMSFVAENSANPAAMFIYGLGERFAEVFGVQDILHNNFWIGELGGNWQDASGVTYFGDISIWTAQLAQGAVEKGVGKFISPYYIFNLFIVPGIIIGTYFQFSNKIERRKSLGLVIIVILLSLLTGTMIPLEFFLLIVSPALLFGHIILSSTLFGVLEYLGIFMGYNYNGGLTLATPGTLVEYIKLLPRISNQTTYLFLAIGAAYMLLSIILVFFYYSFMANDFLDKKHRLMVRKEFIRALGGVSNIKIIDASPFSVEAALYDNSKIDTDLLLELGAYRVREQFFCYYIDYGPGSVSIYRQVKKEIKSYQKMERYLEKR